MATATMVTDNDVSWLRKTWRSGNCQRGWSLGLAEAQLTWYVFFCGDTPAIEAVGSPACSRMWFTLLTADSSANAIASEADASTTASSLAADACADNIALEAEAAIALIDDWSWLMDSAICWDTAAILEVAEARALLRNMMVTAWLLT